MLHWVHRSECLKTLQLQVFWVIPPYFQIPILEIVGPIAVLEYLHMNVHVGLYLHIRVRRTHQSFLRLLLGLRGGLHGRVNPESALLWRLHICREGEAMRYDKRTTLQSPLRLWIDLQAVMFCLGIALDFSKRPLTSCGMYILQDWIYLKHPAYSSITSYWS